MKLRACREVSSDFTAALSANLRFGTPGIDACRAAAKQAGFAAGNRLKNQLRLGNSFSDAELAWQVVAAASGMDFTIERTPGRSAFRHLTCPIFSSGGAALCEDFCLPLVAGLTEAICPSCRVELSEKPSSRRPCTKVLVQSEDSHAG